MENIITFLEDLELLQVLVGAVATGLVYLISKLPAKLKTIVTDVVDEADAKLDAKKEVKEDV